ncbi:MAG: hypothetical protein DI611_12350 [Brachybacterium faecium]|nr:MAG: hypothetical protein DI611_12350 [Brachybacterium faecium]
MTANIGPLNKEKYRQLRQADKQLSWKVDRQGENRYVVTTPNKAVLQFHAPINWAHTPSDQYQSTLLWLYSLVPLRIIADEYEDFAYVNREVRAFHRYITSDDGVDRLNTLTSRDHLTAEYMRTLTYLLTDDRFEARHEAEALLQAAASWALEPGSIAANNHGMMLALSVLHSTPFIPDSSVDQDEAATKQLIAILRSAFDETGLCVENSPAYHHFYIRYMRSIAEEAKILGGAIQDHESEITDLILKAENTLNSVALPNGALPPFGDGNLWPDASPVPPDGEHYSEPSGVYVRREGQMYLAFKCGMSSITHKHVDDNSLYLWANGEPVLLDGGLYNYDWKNRFTLCVKSQRGHSSPQFQRYSETYPATLYRPGAVRVKASITKSHEDEFIILSGTSTIDDMYNTQRTVKLAPGLFLEPISIIDEFSSPDSERKYVRYLVPGHYSISIHENKVLGRSERNILTLEFSNGRVSTLRANDTGERADAWVATGFGEATPAWAIDVELDMVQDTLVTHLTIEPCINTTPAL